MAVALAAELAVDFAMGVQLVTFGVHFVELVEWASMQEEDAGQLNAVDHVVDEDHQVDIGLDRVVDVLNAMDVDADAANVVDAVDVDVDEMDVQVPADAWVADALVIEDVAVWEAANADQQAVHVGLAAVDVEMRSEDVEQHLVVTGHVVDEVDTLIDWHQRLDSNLQNEKCNVIVSKFYFVNIVKFFTVKLFFFKYLSF